MILWPQLAITSRMFDFGVIIMIIITFSSLSSLFWWYRHHHRHYHHHHYYFHYHHYHYHYYWHRVEEIHIIVLALYENVTRYCKRHTKSPKTSSNIVSIFSIMQTIDHVWMWSHWTHSLLHHVQRTVYVIYKDVFIHFCASIPHNELEFLNFIHIKAVSGISNEGHYHARLLSGQSFSYVQPLKILNSRTGMFSIRVNNRHATSKRCQYDLGDLKGMHQWKKMICKMTRNAQYWALGKIAL